VLRYNNTNIKKVKRNIYTIKVLLIAAQIKTNTKIQFYEKNNFGHSFITMSASVQAQLVKFGFKGGLNYANYSGSDLQFDAQQVTRA
jgi:hypothetical protein